MKNDQSTREYVVTYFDLDTNEYKGTLIIEGTYSHVAENADFELGTNEYWEMFDEATEDIFYSDSYISYHENKLS